MASSHTPRDQRQATLADTKWGSKALMRLFATFIGLIAMCLFAAAIGFENSNYQNTTGNGDWPDGLALAPVGFNLFIMFRLLTTLDCPVHSLQPCGIYYAFDVP